MDRFQLSSFFGDSLKPLTRESERLTPDQYKSLFYESDEEARARVNSVVQDAKPERRGLLKTVDDSITSAFGTNKADPNEIDQAGVERVKQEEAARQQAIAARRQELGTDQGRGYAMRTFDSAAAGAAGFVGSTAEYLGRQFGIKTLEELGQKAQIDAAALTPREQDVLQKVAGGIGSFLPMAAAALGTGGAAAALGAGPVGAATVAAAAGAAVEAPSVGQEAYEGALKTTGNEAVAERQGYKAIAYNLPLSFITNKLGFFADKGGRIAQTAKTVVTEGVQEGSQKVLTNVMGYQPTGEGVSEEALIGGLTGGAVKQLTYRAEPEQAKGTQPGTQPGAQDAPSAPSGDAPSATPELPEEIRNLSFSDMTATLGTKPAVAAVLYQDAQTAEERELISRAVDRADAREQFQQALADPRLVEDTRNEMAEFPFFVQQLKDSIPAYVNNMPPAGVVKVPSRTITEKDLDKTIDQAWQDESYKADLEASIEQMRAEQEERQQQRRMPALPRNEMNASNAEPPVPADVQIGTPKMPALASAPAVATSSVPAASTAPAATPAAQTPEEMAQTGNSATLTAKQILAMEYEQKFAELNSKKPSKSRDAKLASHRSFLRKNGFTDEEVQQISSTTGDQLFSKDEAGKVKAVFIKDINTVFYTKLASRLTPQQVYALRLHEVGAHYTLRKMLGDKAYTELLADLRSLRGKDASVDAAYASVPSDTAPSLVDEEALGYLVENNQNMSLVQRLFQFVRDWYAKTFNGQVLTTSQVISLVKSSMAKHAHDVRQVWLTENISTDPKAGRVKVDFDKALDANPKAKQFLDFMSQFSAVSRLSGSLAISAQTDVYRPANEQIHDLDFQVRSQEDLAAISEKLLQQYPNAGISAHFQSKKSGSIVYTYSLDKNDRNALTVDLFLNTDGSYAEQGVERQYVGQDGQQRTVSLVPSEKIFDKKLRMGRAKDINDAIVSGDFGILFSKGSKEDLTEALSKVMQDIVGRGTTSFKEASAQLMSRMRSNKSWAAYADQVTPEMLRQAYLSLPEFNGKDTAETIDAPAQPVAQEQAPVPAAPAPEAKPDTEADVRAYNKVMTLLRDGDKASIGKAAKLFQEAKLFEKGFGNFTEMQREAKTPLLAGKRVEERTRYGTGVRVTADGRAQQVEPVESRMPSNAFRPDDGTVEEVENTGVTFTKVQPKKKPKPAPVEQAAEEPAYTPKPRENTTATRLRDKFDQIIRNSYRIKFFDDTILALQAELDKIDGKLRDIDTIKEFDKNGKLTGIYKARNQDDDNPGLWSYQDENAYDRFEGGQRFDKPSSKQELLDIRRKIADELQFYREKNIAGRARLYRRGVARMFDLLDKERSNAVLGGMSREEAEQIYREYYEQYSVKVDNRPDTDRPSTSTALVPFVDPNVDIDGVQAAMGVISDSKRNKLSERDTVNLLERGMRDGDFTFKNAIDAYRGLKLSPPRELLDTSIQLAVRKPLAEHLKENGNTSAARLEWLTSMRKALQNAPGNISKFTEEEISFYKEWYGALKPLISRRKRDEAMSTATTAETAFPKLLFNRYTLSEAARRTDLRRLFGDAREMWLQDVAYALRRRPDLAPSIFEKIGEDKAEFDAWIAAMKRNIAKEAEVMSKAEAVLELRNVIMPPGSIERIGPEDRVTMDSMPEPDDTPGRPDTGPGRYEQEVVRIINAELSELPAIRDSIARLNAILTSKVDPDTGEILTDALADEAAADILDSLEGQMQESMVQYRDAKGAKRMGKALESGAPAAIKRGEAGFEAGTLERNAEVIRQAGADRFGDKSVRQLQDDDIEVSTEDFGVAENAFEMMRAAEQTDEDTEDGDQDNESDAANEGSGNEEIAAEETSDEQRTRIPGSLTGEEYRFKRGPFSGVLTTSIIAEHLGKITAKWPGAPKINYLPNADHLPEPLRQRVKERLDKHMGAKGLYHNGEVYVFSDFVTTLADAEFVLFHEVDGHLGMRAFLGADFDGFLQRTYDTNPQVRAAVNIRMAQEPIGVLEATDEVLSDMAGENKPYSVVKAYVGKIIAGLRKIGFNRVAAWLSTKTDAEIAYVMKGARDAARNGERPPFNGAPDVIRLAEARLPYEMFSARGGKTTAYTRYNPVTGTWALFTATGDDIRNGWKTEVLSDFSDVMAKMKRQGSVERRTRSGLYIDNKIPSDLQKIPEFRVDPSEIGMSKEGVKTLGRLIKRQATILFQNEYKPVFEVVEYLRSRGRIPEGFDLLNELDGNFERRTGNELDTVRQRFERPIMELVNRLGTQGGNITIGQAFPDLKLPERVAREPLLNAYLIARHAEERNKHIAEINKGKPDGGSGMMTADANKILGAVKGSPFEGTLTEISAILRQISEYKLNRMAESGMISQGSRVYADGTVKLGEKERREFYENYVNLSGFSEGLDAFDDPGQLLAGSSKFATRKDKRSMGRGDLAPDVLARTLLSFEAAVINANKNQVKQKVLSMFEMNYDPDFISINKQAVKRVLDENGQVTEKTDENYIGNKNVMVVHVNGIPITMEFKKTGQGTFADAIHGSIYPPEAGAWPLRALGKVNQVLGQMLTTWNPVWSVINYTRDVQNLYANAVADKRVTMEMAKQMVKYQKQARKAAFHHATEGKRGQDADPEMLRYYKEMREAGGATSFLNFRGLEKKVEELEALLKNKEKGTFAAVGEKVIDTIEAFNIPLEMAPRIAAYRVMRENGYSRSDAAQFAGEITVNFNMRGSAKWARQMFLFFNPAVQGSAKMVKLAVENPKTVTKMAMGMATVGFLANILARAMGGEEEDGTDKLDGIPVYKRATSLLLPNPLGSPPFIAVPIPYGWNAFYAAGHFLADTLWAGTQSAGTTAKRIFQSAFESMSPIGSAGLGSKTALNSVVKAATPTALLPVLEIMLNENRFGAPIAKEEGSVFGRGKRADSEMGFDSASPISAGIAKGLNKLLGGDRVNGALDNWGSLNPSVMDYLIRSYVPGVGAEVYNFASWASAKALGYDTKDAKIPLVDRLTAKTPEGQDFGRFRRAEELINTKFDDFKLNKESRDEILKEYPNLRSAKAAITAAKAQINKLREARNERENKDLTYAEQVDLYNRTRKAEKEIISRAVRRIMETNPEMRKAILASE